MLRSARKNVSAGQVLGELRPSRRGSRRSGRPTRGSGRRAARTPPCRRRGRARRGRSAGCRSASSSALEVARSWSVAGRCRHRRHRRAVAAASTACEQPAVRAEPGRRMPPAAPARSVPAGSSTAARARRSASKPLRPVARIDAPSPGCRTGPIRLRVCARSAALPTPSVTDATPARDGCRTSGPARRLRAPCGGSRPPPRRAPVAAPPGRRRPARRGPPCGRCGSRGPASPARRAWSRSRPSGLIAHGSPTRESIGRSL